MVYKNLLFRSYPSPIIGETYLIQSQHLGPASQHHRYFHFETQFPQETKSRLDLLFILIIAGFPYWCLPSDILHAIKDRAFQGSK